MKYYNMINKQIRFNKYKLFDNVFIKYTKYYN